MAPSGTSMRNFENRINGTAFTIILKFKGVDELKKELVLSYLYRDFEWICPKFTVGSRLCLFQNLDQSESDGLIS